MSTPREQYHALLDNLDSASKLALVDHVPFARLLEEVDPVAYRCGASDFQATCDECGGEFWADDPDEPAVCNDCAERIAAEEDVCPECGGEETADPEAPRCSSCGGGVA